MKKEGRSKFKKNDKKGVSPIIVTVLLILLAIILVVIIALWARGFIKEHLTKFDQSTGEDKSIRDACDNVRIQASISGSNLILINTGDIPVYKVEIRASGEGGEIDTQTEEVNLSPGISRTLAISGSNIEISSILLGKRPSSGQTIEYNCKQEIETTTE